MPSASSHTSGTLAQTININGTLTFMPGNAAPDTVAVSRIGWRPSNYLSCAITGKAYVINVGSTGTLNATEFYFSVQRGKFDKRSCKYSFQQGTVFLYTCRPSQYQVALM